MKKRFISILLSVCMITSLLPVFGTTAFAADTVTRAEWISQLVETFAMTVENDDNMPDNYFSDITEDDSCYRDILLAVEFGVIDIEAGDAFEPDKPTTREFAAQTLNHALQFQLAEDAEYTYSESGDVTYPDDIQVAVNRGWFALSGDNFLPEKAVTSAEADAMLADAANVLDADVIDENYDSTYEFAAGVIEIPQTADVSISADTVTITDCSESISAGDIFVVYTSGYPIAFKALSVETVDNTIVINVTTDGTEDAIVSVDAEGIIDIDLENFEANELTTYSITNMETGKQEELTVELMGISYDKKSKTLTASQQIKIGKSAAGSVSIKMSNLKLNHKENILTNNYMAYITADTTVTTAISFDFGNYAGLPSSMTLGYINIYGIGSISLTFECAIEGGVSMAWDGKLKTGFTYTEHDGFRFEKEYTQKDFTFTAETKINACVRLTAAIDLVLIKGSVWGTIGVRVNFIYKDHGSGKPKMCETLNGYLYARVGVDVEIIGIDVFNRSVDIFTENNSPVRVYSHYEDSLRVEACTRGQDVKYVTKTSSKYFNPAPSYGQSSYESSGSSSGNGSSGGSSGGSGSGTSETVVIWEYKVDSDNNATITGYKGTSTAVAIPSKIDGYTVTAIGSSAFKNNKSIKSVTMPNTIIAIGSSAFYNCTNLSNVQLPAYIEKLEYYAFSGCDSLTEIVIPKTLTSCPGSLGYGYGPFNGSGIVTAEFEDGMTEIPSDVFLGSNKLKNVKIPDTVIKIKNEAFRGCSSLETIKIPNNVTHIEESIFSGCSSLKEISIPDSVTSMGTQIFKNCTSLEKVKLPIKYNNIPESTFYNCQNLVEINLSETITSINSSAFYGCSKFENVILPKYLEKIGGSAFYECAALKEITIPDSVTSIGNSAFYNCDSLVIAAVKGSGSIGSNAFYDCDALTTLTIGNGITSIGSNMCYGCDSLTDVTFGIGLTTIPDSAFRLCSSLQEVILPRYCTKISANA
ncbi:MAG: leucine-rich repeat domain-containing protein, partial [Oscillospiraceae bacterium]|nr:leucine-rich repeat domain-containing protein [Oscillospiraceae bacterium]